MYISFKIRWISGSQSVVAKPAASCSYGNFLERKTLRTHPIPTETESRNKASKVVCFNKFS